MTISKIVSLLSPYIPAALAVKGIGKISPELQSFATSAAAGGYSTNAILDFLRNKLEVPGYSQEQNRLEQGRSRGSLRPDEAASLERVKQREVGPTAVGTGLTAASALAAPFATSALNSVVGSKEQQTQQEQVSQQPVADPEQENQPSYDGLAGLKQFPQLVKFIQKEAASGQGVTTIVGKARKSRALGSMISQIEETSGEPFEALLTRLIGTSSKSGQQSPQGVSGKTQFLQGLNQLGSLLQGLKGR
jgi:hypothetical protein